MANQSQKTPIDKFNGRPWTPWTSERVPVNEEKQHEFVKAMDKVCDMFKTANPRERVEYLYAIRQYSERLELVVEEDRDDVARQEMDFRDVPMSGPMETNNVNIDPEEQTATSAQDQSSNAMQITQDNDGVKEQGAASGQNEASDSMQTDNNDIGSNEQDRPSAENQTSSPTHTIQDNTDAGEQVLNSPVSMRADDMMTSDNDTDADVQQQFASASQPNADVVTLPGSDELPVDQTSHRGPESLSGSSTPVQASQQFDSVDSDLKIGIYRGTTVPDVYRLRADATDRLQAARVALDPSNAVPSGRFDPKEILCINKIYFCNFVGFEGLCQAVTIINESHQNGVSSFYVYNADQLRGLNLPRVVTAVLYDLTWLYDPLRKLPAGVVAYLYSLRLYLFKLHYDELVVAISTRNEDVVRQLQVHNLTMDGLDSHAVLAQKYLQATMRYSDTRRITDMLRQAQIVQLLVDQFGPGVVVVMPAYGPAELEKVGGDKVLVALRVIRNVLGNHYSGVQRIMNWLQHYVYEPVAQNKEILVSRPAKSRTRSFLETLEQVAIVPASALKSKCDTR